MSIHLDDGHFWLPTNFLTDEDTKPFPTTGAFSLQDALFVDGTKKPVEVNRSDISWNMVYAAVTEDLARMRFMEEANKNRAMFAQTMNHGFNGTASYKQLRLAQFLQHQQQQMMKQQDSGASWGWNKLAVGVCPKNTQNHSLSPLTPAAWPKQNQHKQQSGSGMRAIFLANNTAGGTNRECAGTGVFLPRPAGSPANSRKKSGCSTVLLPDRVVQALNLNHKAKAMAMEGKTHMQLIRNTNNISKPMNGDLKNMISNNTGKAGNQEICLPQEWIY